ncbi:uncharacterized protein LOC131852803 [Achroia grisella]|uniref:uncharacterized protein LOC131852803 n=1 Tax=Achroia grisella TaxID=688607 RepID=UPI0027D1FEA8|nr:uncharacterized protein LOC131852803 [Achroia grisella]
MPQRSAEDALYNLMSHIRSKLHEKKMIVLISLDIEGAFDSAWWPMIRVRLAEEKCPVNLRRVIDSYLRDRAVEVRYAGARATRQTEIGCVQGSIGGPLLWNVLLDPLLRQLEHQGVYCQAFADDVALVFDGWTALDIESRANAGLEHVRKWGVVSRLRFAPHKTCAMLITRKLKYDTPRLSMGGVAIGMTESVKLLGLTIDHRLTFNAHMAAVCKKAIAIYKQLARAAKVNWGLHPEVTRTIYTAVVEPIIMYAASAWSESVTKIEFRRQLSVVQRGFAQKICRAYRTVSLNSALVLSGILPLDLRIREAASLYEARRGKADGLVGDRDVERMTPAADKPHPAEQGRLEFRDLVDEEQYKTAQQDCEIRIFTDGSKIEGRVGAALSVWNRATETKALKLALSAHCTVYQAELLALSRAVGIASEHPATTIGILSDSRAALQTVANPKASHPLAEEFRRRHTQCKQNGKTINIYWIKAHAGWEGNERADHLAKEAALKSKRRSDYDWCPVSFAKRLIRDRTIAEWDRRYQSGETASVTKLFFPSAADAYRVVGKITADKYITQLFTGHGGFRAYLHRFRCRENPSCPCDQHTPETLLHIISQCPRFGRKRMDLEIEIEMEIKSENFKEIIKKKKKIEKNF